MRLAFLLLVAAGCSKKADDSPSSSSPNSKAPPLTAERLPAEAKGLKVGEAQENDVNAAFAGLEWKKDKSLGGAATVTFNEAPVAQFTGDGVYGYLADTGSGLRLVQLGLKKPGLWDFVKTKIASDDARRCPGNRKTGEMGTVAYRRSRGVRGSSWAPRSSGGPRCPRSRARSSRGSRGL